MSFRDQRLAACDLVRPDAADAVVSYFLDHESAAESRNMHIDLARLAALDLGESALAARFRAFGSEYDPAATAAVIATGLPC